MATTIALGRATLDMLRMVKEELHSQSYDEAIVKMITRIKTQRKSYFGKFKGLGKFEREEIDRLDCSNWVHTPQLVAERSERN